MHATDERWCACGAVDDDPRQHCRRRRRLHTATYTSALARQSHASIAATDAAQGIRAPAFPASRRLQQCADVRQGSMRLATQERHTCVQTAAAATLAPARRADPIVMPNQPIQSIRAPSAASGRLCFPVPLRCRGPSTAATITAENPTATHNGNPPAHGVSGHPTDSPCKQDAFRLLHISQGVRLQIYTLP